MDFVPIASSPWGVSVAIVCHNYGHYLDGCIDSVARQTQPPYEVFVVDDASTDNTAAICEQRGITHLRVEHRDVHSARRTAFEHATGDVIVFLDADDELSPDYVRSGCELFADPRVGIVYSDVEFFGSQGGQSNYLTGFSARQLSRENFIHAGALVRMDAIRLSSAFALPARARTNADWILWRRIVRHGWLAAKQSALYRYRRHPGQMSEADAEFTYYQKADLDHEPITLFVPLSGREDLWPRCVNQLERLACARERLSLVLFNTSQSARFGRLVESWIADGCQFPDVRHVRRAVGPPGLASQQPKSPQMVAAVRIAMARTYGWAREHVTTDFVMCLADDVCAPPDVVDRLLQCFDQYTDSVSGACLSRSDDVYVAWRIGGGPTHPIPRGERGAGLDLIGGTGFGCIMLRTDFLRSTMLTDVPHNPSGSTSHDFDIAFFQQAQRAGRVCKIDWSIECEHGVT